MNAAAPISGKAPGWLACVPSVPTGSMVTLGVNMSSHRAGAPNVIGMGPCPHTASASKVKIPAVVIRDLPYGDSVAPLHAAARQLRSWRRTLTQRQTIAAL
jgi:hypothetical protein